MDATTIPAQLRAARLAAGLTQQAVADRLGVKVLTVCRWEGGHQRPDTAMLARLAELLKIKIQIG